MYPRDLTWVELRDYVSKGVNPLIIPVGSIEGHGAHLPIDTDVLIASFIADEVAKRFGWVSLPPVTYSITVPTRVSNVCIPTRVFSEYLKSILEHFASYGQRKFVIVLGHGGPDMKRAVVNACSPICLERGAAVGVYHVSQILRDLGLVDTSIDRHAGGWETSMVMAIDGGLVKSLSAYRSLEDLRRYGVAGNPLEASPQRGAELINAVVSYVGEEAKKLELGKCIFNWVKG